MNRFPHMLIPNICFHTISDYDYYFGKLFSVFVIKSICKYHSYSRLGCPPHPIKYLRNRHFIFSKYGRCIFDLLSGINLSAYGMELMNEFILYFLADISVANWYHFDMSEENSIEIGEGARKAKPIRISTTLSTLEIKARIKRKQYELLDVPAGTEHTRYKSFVWKIFSEIRNDKGEILFGHVCCRKCFAVLSYMHQSTSNMSHHPCCSAL